MSQCCATESADLQFHPPLLKWPAGSKSMNDQDGGLHANQMLHYQGNFNGQALPKLSTFAATLGRITKKKPNGLGPNDNCTKGEHLRGTEPWHDILCTLAVAE
eukprot:1159282-Pelagomonas_calceolata.AAC.5